MYLESLVAYNKAIIELNYRQGILLRDNCIAIADVDQTFSPPDVPLPYGKNMQRPGRNKAAARPSTY